MNSFLLGMIIGFIAGGIPCLILGYWLGTAKQEKLKVRTLPKHALEQLKQIALKPVWDGDLMSKTSRDELFTLGLIERHNGNNFLTREGIDFLKRTANLPRSNKRGGA